MPHQYPLDMSPTPKYSPLGHSEPLLQGDTRSSTDLEAQKYPPAYPRHVDGGPVQPEPEVAEGGTTVTYTFVPQWPMKGERQEAVGVVGTSKAVSPLPAPSLRSRIACRRHLSIATAGSSVSVMMSEPNS